MCWCEEEEEEDEVDKNKKAHDLLRTTTLEPQQ